VKDAGDLEGNSSHDSYHAYMESPFRSIKHSTYFQVYDHLFLKFRNKPVTFLEIGVLGGGSLMMWRKFLGPEARIIGIDRNPKALELRKHGFEIFIGDQADPSFWSHVIPSLGAIDVVLDDGGHTYSQQVETLMAVLPCVKDGGVVAIEDAHTSYMPGFGPRRHSLMKFSYKFVDGINKRFGRFESNRSTAASGPVWNIQFFESIVCFHVDRQRAGLLSQTTENMPPVAVVEDFRFGAPGRMKLAMMRLEKFLGGRFTFLLKALKVLASLFVGVFRSAETFLNRGYVRHERSL
jgi:cephalosporin hydroxylase